MSLSGTNNKLKKAKENKNDEFIQDMKILKVL